MKLLIDMNLSPGSETMADEERRKVMLCDNTLLFLQ